MATKPQIEKVFNLSVVTGKYTDKEGKEKNSRLKVWVWFLKDNGTLSVKLDAMPVKSEYYEWWISGFPQERKEKPADPVENHNPDSDDLPF